MKTLIEKITRRFFTKYMLLNMLHWFATPEDSLGPIFALLDEFPDDARPIILSLWRLYPLTGIRAIIDSIRYHYY